MADISHIRLNGSVYDIKDDSARTNIASITSAIVNLKVYAFDTFLEIDEDAIEENSIVVTKGFRTVNDGGCGAYLAVDIDESYPVRTKYSYKLMDEPNILNVGGYGDGVNADNTVIQNALAHYHKLDLIGKTCFVNNGITMSGNSTIKNGKIVLNGNATFNVFNCANISNCTFENLIFDRTETSQNTATHYYISCAESCSNFKIHNCSFNRGYGYMVRINGSTYFDVCNCVLNDANGVSGNPGGGIYINGGSGHTFDRITAIGLQDHAIYIDGSNSVSRIKITNLTGYDARYTALTTSAVIVVYGNAEQINISNCNFANVRCGITITYRDGVSPRNITITGCTFNTLSQDGIQVIGLSGAFVQYISIGDCVFVSCTQDGIGVRYGANVNISNCVLKNIGRYATEISGGTSNSINSCSYDTANTGIILGYTSAGNTLYPSVSNCNFRGEFVNGIYDRSSTGASFVNNKMHGTYTGSIYYGDYEGLILQNFVDTTKYPSVYYANHKPTQSADGDHVAGDIALDITGATNGWRCTVSGKPGTWVNR